MFRYCTKLMENKCSKTEKQVSFICLAQERKEHAVFITSPLLKIQMLL